MSKLTYVLLTGLFIFVLAVSSLLVGAFPDDAPETPKADSKGTGKVSLFIYFNRKCIYFLV